jgi:hypothetical protein
MIYRRDAAAFAAVIVVLFVSVASRAEPPGLATLDPDRRAAFVIEQQFFHRARPKLVEQFRNEILPNFLKDESYAKESYSYVTEIDLLRPKPGTDEKLAVVVRYDYSSGLTFQTTIDLNQRKQVAIHASANRVTLLATPEIERAAAVVTKKIPGTLLSPDTVSARPINDDATTSKSYGHRLVVLWQDQPERSTHYLVDLTTDEILSPDY